MQNNPEQLLKEGQALREQGSTFEAIDVLNRAMDLFLKEKNYSRFAHAVLDRAICWQHLFQFHSNDIAYAILYKKDAEAMLELVKTKELQSDLAEANFINAKSAVLFDDYTKAVEFFEQAIKGLDSEKKAQAGDWRTNFGKALYKTGQKEEGRKEMLEGIEQIKNNTFEVDEYTAKVWISGGYLRLAEVLDHDDPEAAKEYLSNAKEIIDTDPELFKVRLIQYNNLLETGVSGL